MSDDTGDAIRHIIYSHHTWQPHSIGLPLGDFLEAR
jgi:hypothetical protein